MSAALRKLLVFDMTSGQSGALELMIVRPTFSAPPNPVSASTIAGIFTAWAMYPASVATSFKVSNPISGKPAVQLAIPAPLI